MPIDDTTSGLDAASGSETPAMAVAQASRSSLPPWKRKKQSVGDDDTTASNSEAMLDDAAAEQLLDVKHHPTSS